MGEAFGFERHFVAEHGGEVVHAHLRFGRDLIMLGPDRADDRYGLHSPLALNGTNQCVSIAIEGSVDDAFERARQAGAVIVTEPYDTAYGAREFSCNDTEGHVWCLGSYSGEPIVP